MVASGRVERDGPGRAVRLDGVVIDITARREAEGRVRASEARFRSLWASDMPGIGFWDVDGTLSDPNDALLGIAGYTRSGGTRVPVLIGGGCFDGTRDQGPFFALDITALKRAVRDARRGEQFYRMLTEAVPGIVWSANTVDGLDYASPRWSPPT